MWFSFYRSCSITLMCFFPKNKKVSTCWLSKIEKELSFGKHLFFLEEHMKFVKWIQKSQKTTISIVFLSNFFLKKQYMYLILVLGLFSKKLSPEWGCNLQGSWQRGDRVLHWIRFLVFDWKTWLFSGLWFSKGDFCVSESAELSVLTWL